MAIELPVDLERRLEMGARARGISKNEFATRLVADSLPDDAFPAPLPPDNDAASRAHFASIAAQVRARTGATPVSTTQSREQRERARAALEAEWERMRQEWEVMTPEERARVEAEQVEFFRQMEVDRRGGE